MLPSSTIICIDSQKCMIFARSGYKKKRKLFTKFTSKSFGNSHVRFWQKKTKNKNCIFTFYHTTLHTRTRKISPQFPSKTIHFCQFNYFFLFFCSINIHFHGSRVQKNSLSTNNFSDKNKIHRKCA